MGNSKRDLLKFCGPTENSLSNLENGVIFCQHFSAYNDPFEFWHDLYEGIPDPEKEPERLAAALEAWGMTGSSPFNEDVVEYFDECQHYQPPFKAMRESVRIACFGSERDNMLMWSHYADGLRGFCIVFDEDAVAAAEPEAYVFDVDYRDAPPIVDSFVYAIARDQNWYHQLALEETQTRIEFLGMHDEKHWVPLYEQAASEAIKEMRDIWQNVFAVKPLSWEYERERRLLVQTQQNGTSPILRRYPREAIKEIILGERMEGIIRQQILAILKINNPNVPVRTARRAQGLYSIQID